MKYVFHTDGLLNQDQETLGEQVAILKKKVQQQGDEIVCLKSAFADVIRKLNQFQEASCTIQNNVLPAKPAFMSTRRYGDKKNVHPSPVDSVHNSPSRSTTPPAQTSPSHKANSASLKKWSIKPFINKRNFSEEGQKENNGGKKKNHQDIAHRTVVWQRDTEAKRAIKRYADRKAYVKPNDFIVGDTVIVKTDYISKALTPYQPNPMTIIKKKDP